MTQQLSIFVRWALYVDLMLLFGLPLFAMLGAAREYRPRLRLARSQRVLTGLACVGLILSLAGFALLTASMAGVEIPAINRDSVMLVLTQTAAGTAWIVRMLVLGIVLLLTFRLKRKSGHALFAILAGSAAVALGSLAWGGHAAAGEGSAGTIQLVADIVHLLAAGVWIGALAGLSAMVLTPQARATGQHIAAMHDSLRRFSLTGSIVVALLVTTGLVNSWMLIGLGQVGHLPDSLYGQLMIGKLALFGMMLCQAAVNRFALTPRLARTMATDGLAGALANLRRSLALEAASALAVLALVAWLGTLEPPIATG